MSGGFSDKFDPSQFERGDVAHGKEDGPQSDSAGRWQRGHIGMVGLFTGYGAKCVTYPLMMEHDEAENCRWIKIVIRGVYVLPGLQKGEEAPKLRDGLWQAEIKGERLGPIVQHLFLGYRISIKPSGKVDDDKKPEVDRIEIRAIEPESF